MRKAVALAVTTTVLAVTVSNAAADPPATSVKGQRANPEAVFKRIDTNGDGKLSKDEFRAFIEKAIKGKLSSKPELIDKLFDHLDTNGDGYLSLDEFKKLRDLREKLAEKKKSQTPTRQPSHERESRVAIVRIHHCASRCCVTTVHRRVDHRTDDPGID
jgi:hypothetical protein